MQDLEYHHCTQNYLRFPEACMPADKIGNTTGVTLCLLGNCDVSSLSAIAACQVQCASNGPGLFLFAVFENGCGICLQCMCMVFARVCACVVCVQGCALVREGHSCVLLYCFPLYSLETACSSKPALPRQPTGPSDPPVSSLHSAWVICTCMDIPVLFCFFNVVWGFELWSLSLYEKCLPH